MADGTRAAPRPAAAEPAWRVVRLDDNGNVFVVADGLDRAAARALAARFEARAHKQIYWAEPAQS